MLWVWRHPRPVGIQGRCIGHTDVALDRRRAKRLARRIQRVARREGLPRRVLTSPLRRARAVGEWLARWGWQHRVDPRLSEVSFGDWDGQPWSAIGPDPVQAWCDDFAGHAPGGGESLLCLFERCRSLLGEVAGTVEGAMCVVGHAGWMSAARHLAQGLPPPARAADWPAPLPYGGLLVLSREGLGLACGPLGAGARQAERPMPSTMSPNARP